MFVSACQRWFYVGHQQNPQCFPSRRRGLLDSKEPSRLSRPVLVDNCQPEFIHNNTANALCSYVVQSKATISARLFSFAFIRFCFASTVPVWPARQLPAGCFHLHPGASFQLAPLAGELCRPCCCSRDCLWSIGPRILGGAIDPISTSTFETRVLFCWKQPHWCIGKGVSIVLCSLHSKEFKSFVFCLCTWFCDT